MSKAAKALGVPSGSIIMYFSRNTQKPYKKNIYFQAKQQFVTKFTDITDIIIPFFEKYSIIGVKGLTHVNQKDFAD